MKVLVLLGLVAAACAFGPELKNDAPYSIIAEELIPMGERIRKAEERMVGQRITGGTEARLGEVPYQAGLLAGYAGIEGTGICGGSLLTAERVVTAAHCWFDGVNQAWIFTVVLGSTRLFVGRQGISVDTSVVVMHPEWSTSVIRSDIAVVYLPVAVAFSDTISPIALPNEAHLGNTFEGQTCIVSGFGVQSDGGGITLEQSLHLTFLQIISNRLCSLTFPFLVHESNVCAVGFGNSSACNGDSGGPLVCILGGERILVGVVSFGSPRGCENGAPSAYARVTSFLNFIRPHLN